MMSLFFEWLSNLNKNNAEKPKKPFKKSSEFEQMKHLWELSEEKHLPEVPDITGEWNKLQHVIATAEAAETQAEEIPRIRQFFYIQRFAAAACLIGIIALSIWFGYYKYTTFDYETGRKEFLTVVLPDQTTVQLNCDSRLIYKKGLFADSRNVILEGEGFFDVQKNGRPFHISTEVGEVRVVGTKFNVRARTERLDVSVHQGSVQVSSRLDQRDSTVTLIPGEFSVCRKDAFPIQPERVPFEVPPAWMHDHLAFFQTEFQYVCEELERRFDVSIHIADTTIKDVTITGLFNAGDIHQTLSALRVLINRGYRYEKNTIIFG